MQLAACLHVLRAEQCPNSYFDILLQHENKLILNMENWRKEAKSVILNTLEYFLTFLHQKCRKIHFPIQGKVLRIKTTYLIEITKKRM